MQTTVRRRIFLNRLLLLGAGTSALPAFALPNPFVTVRRKEVMLEQLTLSDFAPHLGSGFQLINETGQTIGIELVEATALGGTGPRPAHLTSRAPFSVVFLAPGNSGLTQRIYRVEHEVMGEFEIFLVPIGLTAQGLKCEAIFN